MPDLERAVTLIMAAHPGPTVERLMIDLWVLGLNHGESEGLRYAQMYANSFRAYADAKKRLQASAERGATRE